MSCKALEALGLLYSRASTPTNHESAASGVALLPTERRAVRLAYMVLSTRKVQMAGLLAGAYARPLLVLLASQHSCSADLLLNVPLPVGVPHAPRVSVRRLKLRRRPRSAGAVVAAPPRLTCSC